MDKSKDKRKKNTRRNSDFDGFKHCDTLEIAESNELGLIDKVNEVNNDDL